MAFPDGPSEGNVVTCLLIQSAVDRSLRDRRLSLYFSRRDPLPASHRRVVKGWYTT